MQPLDGIRVIEVAQTVAGAVCGRLLGLAGAEVLKVEPPGGDPLRRVGPFVQDREGPEASCAFHYLNAGKQGVTLDLTTPRGQELFRGLLRGRHILVASADRPSALLCGADYAELEAVNPALVCTVITHFGLSGPYREFLADHAVLSALAGVSCQCGDPDREPLTLGGWQLHYLAGTLAAVGTAAALLEAEADEAVRVVILGGVGPSFSAGHDLGSAVAREERQFYQTTRQGTERRWLREWEYYFTYNLRWRELRKITVAQVQGYCLAAALMLAWSCDLIVAADDAVFADVVGTRLGMCGVEYFGHPWEFGPRKAKELLLTGDALTAEEAYRLGMVSKVFPRERMEEETLNFARRIARIPTMTALLVKDAVNYAQDMQGFTNSLRMAFSLHQMNHAHWAEVTNGATALNPEFTGPGRMPPLKVATRNSSGWDG